MSQRILVSRRHALRSLSAGVAGLSAGVFSGTAPRPALAASDKLRIAIIGTANRAGENINGVAGQEIAAVCDIDDTYLAQAKGRFPAARAYVDYRELIEQEAGKIDAVVVSTADHHHAPASIRAIRRKMQFLARGGERPAAGEEPPATLHWDLWLGPAPVRPFAAGRYHPAQWRRWWDFGNGTLGDMGCHYMDLPFWALDLKYPTACEAEGPAPHPETCPLGLVVHY
ncbi:MAG: gfo/Idh/MocA family oxidoreductase, partial [Planctomycetia bacterium]|nr:gfo/Idh/MocA family oxidoreductase [Planctomycetia bacterium]